MKLEFEVEGVTELADDFRGLAKDLDDLDFRTVADRAASLARSFAPRDTGELIASIKPGNRPSKAIASAFAPYASVINYGSARRNIEATLFMQKADRALDAVPLVDKVVQDAIDERGMG